MALTAELKNVVKDAQGKRRFRLLVDAACRNNVRPSVGNVFVPAGIEISACAEGSNDRGELFFAIEGSPSVCVELPASIYKTRHPYDAGVFDPSALEVIGAEDTAPVWP